MVLKYQTMKNLLYLLGFVFLFISCNTEIPEDQFRAQFGDQCMNKLASKIVGEDATVDQKNSFCDCYIDAIIADSEVITMKTMFKAMSNFDQFQATIDNCKENALTEDVMQEVTDSTKMEIDSTEAVMDTTNQ